MPKKALHRPLESIPLTATAIRRRKTALSAATLAKLSVTIVTKKTIIWINALSHLKQKTSIGHGNFRVND